MSRACRAILFVAVLGILTFLGGRKNAVQAQSNNPPFLVCGLPNSECSYILWNGGGSVGYVVPYPNMHFPISDQYIGFNFCIHAARPRAPMPQWPGCLGKPETATDHSGVIKRGKNG